MIDYKNRVGEVFKLNNGENVEIIEYVSALNTTIQFEDGVIKTKVIYACLKEGSVSKPVFRVGEKHTNNNGENFTILEYFKFSNCTIQFEDGTVLYNVDYGNVKRGTIKNPYFPANYGIGYIGIGKYKSTTSTGWNRVGETWSGMLKRCSSYYQRKYPTYIGCSVDERWHNFQNFAEWMEQNYNPETMQGWHLDKDIIVKGNKIYSPETCAFVPKEINGLFKSTKKRRGVYPIGITGMEGAKYRVECQREGRVSRIGTYHTPEKAFQAYKKVKEEYIKEIADKWKGLISEQVYQALINYNVEITD